MQGEPNLTTHIFNSLRDVSLFFLTEKKCDFHSWNCNNPFGLSSQSWVCYRVDCAACRWWNNNLTQTPNLPQEIWKEKKTTCYLVGRWNSEPQVLHCVHYCGTYIINTTHFEVTLCVVSSQWALNLVSSVVLSSVLFFSISGVIAGG